MSMEKGTTRSIRCQFGDCDTVTSTTGHVLVCMNGETFPLEPAEAAQHAKHLLAAAQFCPANKESHEHQPTALAGEQCFYCKRRLF